jgi:hypothetical protein
MLHIEIGKINLECMEYWSDITITVLLCTRNQNSSNVRTIAFRVVQAQSAVCSSSRTHDRSASNTCDWYQYVEYGKEDTPCSRTQRCKHAVWAHLQSYMQGCDENHCSLRNMGKVVWTWILWKDKLRIQNVSFLQGKFKNYIHKQELFSKTGFPLHRSENAK